MVTVTSASIISRDSYSEPEIDGVINEREYYDAASHYIYLQSMGSRLHTMMYAKNDRDHLYLAFKIEDSDPNNLMVLLLADDSGNVVSKHSRSNEVGWSLYLEGEEYINGDTASFSSSWSSQGLYKIVEWKIPLYTDNVNDLKTTAGKSIRLAIQYGQDSEFTFPYTYDYKNPKTWDWLTTITPSPIKNGEFQDQILQDPWEIPGWRADGWLEPVTGRVGGGMRIFEGNLEQTVEAKDDESLFFWYLARPEGRELHWHVSLDNILVYEKTLRGNNSDYNWTMVEIKFSDVFENLGVRKGDIPLMFQVSSTNLNVNGTHPSLCLDSVEIGESSPTIVMDDVYVEDDHCDVGTLQEVGFHFSLKPRNINLLYTAVEINGTSYLSDSDGWVRFPVECDVISSKRWVVNSVNGSQEFISMVENPEIICDKVIINVPSSQRVDVGSDFDWSGKYAYSNQVFNGDLLVNHPQDISNKVGKVEYDVTGVIDYKFGLCNFIANPFTVIYDKVKLDLSLEDSRIDVDTNPRVSHSGHYLYDSSKFEGSITLSEPSSDIGKAEITVTSITDRKHGLSIFECNSVECIWDTIKITQSGASKYSCNIGEEVEVWFYAEYAYDSKPFTGEDGQLYINGEEATWTESDSWVSKVSSDSSAKLSVSVNSINDDRYGLSSFSSMVDDVEVEWNKTSVPGFQPLSILLTLLVWTIFSRSNLKTKDP